MILIVAQENRPRLTTNITRHRGSPVESMHAWERCMRTSRRLTSECAHSHERGDDAETVGIPRGGRGFRRAGVWEPKLRQVAPPGP